MSCIIACFIHNEVLHSMHALIDFFCDSLQQNVRQHSYMLIIFFPNLCQYNIIFAFEKKPRIYGLVINFYADDHSMRYLKDKDPIVKSTAVA